MRIGILWNMLMLSNLFKKIRENKVETLLLLCVLVIAGVAHGYNMFHFPYYEADEGTYLSQAWAVLTQGKLAIYTYWYDHAPVGWFLIAIWTFLTGGLFTFGFSVNSGRVLMLVLHLFSCVFLYLIAKKTTNSKLVGLISILLFSLSPLAIYYHRRVLLDNIEVFWTLLSLYLILNYKNKLRYIILSAITFGIAILSKESAIFFIPAFLYFLFDQSHKNHKIFTISKWLFVTGIIVGFYFLYATLKGELFPAGTYFGGTNDHVSLLGTLKFQASRGKISIFEPGSTFWSIAGSWKRDDPIFVIMGAISTVLTLLVGIKHKGSRYLGLLASCYWLFLLRGGLVLEFYLVPLIPFISLTTACAIWYTTFFFPFLKTNIKKIIAPIPAFIIMGFIIFSFFKSANTIRNGYSIYTSDQTTAQINAVNYILSQKRPNAFYVIDNYSYLDLNLKNDGNFKNAEYHWKVDGDTDIRDKILHNSVDNIDYVAFTPLIGSDINTGELPLVGKAMASSAPIVSFNGDGWYVQIWGVKNSRRILNSSWQTYKSHFIKAGRVQDPYINNATTSEGQSYAMLQSVWLNDKEVFDQVYTWSQIYLGMPNDLYSWKWEGTTEKGKRVDNGNATDADEDIALSLLFAYKKWGDSEYLVRAKKIINAIWENEVTTVNGVPYLTAGNWANQEHDIVINPSYLSPATYRVFAEVDTKHDWKAVVDSSYVVLNGCSTALLDKDTSGVLPPEWCAMEKVSGKFVQPNNTTPRATEYSYNAFRIPWRVGLDYLWNKEPRAKDYLASLTTLGEEYKSKNKLSTAYQHTGEVWEDYESVAAYGGNLAYFAITKPDMANDIYQNKLLSKLFEDQDRSYWDDPHNYYAQNWAWFGTAFYSNNLPNLWKE